MSIRNPEGVRVFTMEEQQNLPEWAKSLAREVEHSRYSANFYARRYKSIIMALEEFSAMTPGHVGAIRPILETFKRPCKIAYAIHDDIIRSARRHYERIEKMYEEKDRREWEKIVRKIRKECASIVAETKAKREGKKEAGK